MRTLILFLLLVLTSLPTISGQDIAVTTEAKNKYLGVAGGIFWDQPVLQSSISLSGNNYYVLLWHSRGLDNAAMWGDFDDEVDLLAGYLFEYHGINVEIGTGHFWINRSSPNADGNIFTLFGSISQPVTIIGSVTVSPFIRGEYYTPTQGNTPSQGILLYGGVSGSYQLNPFSFAASANVLKDSGAFGFDASTHGQGALTVSWQVSDWFSINTGLRLSTPLTAVDDSRQTYLQYSGGITITP